MHGDRENERDAERPRDHFPTFPPIDRPKERNENTVFHNAKLRGLAVNCDVEFFFDEALESHKDLYVEIIGHIPSLPPYPQRRAPSLTLHAASYIVPLYTPQLAARLAGVLSSSVLG